MANLLFLAHRLPYPPNKGDKVRSFHLLRHLAARHRVFVGSFIDDPDDAVHLPALQGMVADVHAEPLHPRQARIASLAGLLDGSALTLHYYRSAPLARWVDETVARERIDAVVVFSSSMGQYALRHPDLPMLVDLVDVDSAKWAGYARQRRWPMSWIYAREAERLLACERALVLSAARSYLSTEKETALFESLAPECVGRVQSMNNGVNADYFASDPQRPSPFRDDEIPLVFTGAMDYWPNVDAITWFVGAVLPGLLRRYPSLCLHVVGRNPASEVRALAAAAAVVVSGTVPDVRPYLQHAAVVIAPLRLARGVQNKVLEAMAMGRPVVAALACVGALTVVPGQEIVSAEQPADYEREISALLDAPSRAERIGAAGRRRVLETYTWDAHLALIDAHLLALTQARPLQSTEAIPVGDGL